MDHKHEAEMPRLPGEMIGDAWRKFRAEKLGDRDFRRRAAAFPLTRPIATQAARKLFDLTAGFVYSQILKAVVDLDILEKLKERPRSAEELSGEIALKPDRAEKLLDAAVALELLEKRDGVYELGVLGLALADEPGVRAMIAHHDMLYDDLRDPVALLRGEAGETKLSRFWPYAGAAGEAGDAVGAEAAAPYSSLMASSQSFVADDVLDVVSFGDRNSLVDIGGGDGAFVEAVAKRWPHLKITMVDLPAVAARAEQRLAAEGLAGRVSTKGGDFFSGPLPEGADVVSLVRVLHDHDDAEALQILQRIHAALGTNGELLVAEPLAEMPGAKRVGHAYFAFYLMAMGSGRPRTPAEVAGLLQQAGFWNVRTQFTRGALPLGIVTARRAGEGPVWRD